MGNFNDADVELIFDAVARSAIIRRGESLIWLAGPFRTYGDAEQAARARIAGANEQPSVRLNGSTAKA